MKSDRIYSPTQTDLASRCRLLWFLDRCYRAVGNHDTKLYVGRAISDGMDRVFQGLRSPGPNDLTDAVSAAHSTLSRDWQEDPEYTLDGMKQVVERCLKVGHGIAPQILEGGSIVAIQKDLGVAKPDLITRHPDGLHIIDVKWSEILRPEWVQSRLEKQETDIQLNIYAILVGETYGERVSQVGFLHITGNSGTGKARAYYEPTLLDEDHVDRIIRPALFAQWAIMNEDERKLAEDPNYLPPGRLTACLSKDENYGRCKMYDACHLYYLKPERMAHFYTRRA